MVLKYSISVSSASFCNDENNFSVDAFDTGGVARTRTNSCIIGNTSLSHLANISGLQILEPFLFLNHLNAFVSLQQ